MYDRQQQKRRRTSYNLDTFCPLKLQDWVASGCKSQVTVPT
jgi:hypothetical protein